MRAAYVSPDLNYSPWSRVSKIISFVKGFYPTWDDAYCASLLANLQVGLDDRIQLALVRREDQALAGAGAVVASSVADSRRTDDRARCHFQAAGIRRVAVGSPGEDRAVLISSHAITDLERFADHVD